VTSGFRHADKKHREFKTFQNFGFKVLLIDEPGYKYNVSFARFLSHREWLKNFKRWFIQSYEDLSFDLVYSAYPLVSTNIFLGKVKNRFGFRLIVDVQDIWPESIVSAIPMLASLPWRRLPLSIFADRAYRSADALVAVSETYLSRARINNPHVPSMCLYIGADFSKISKLQTLTLRNSKESGTFDFVYLGSLGASYDIETLILAFNKLDQENIPVYLHLIGCGPNDNYLKSLAGRRVIFHGLLSYDDALGYCKNADFLVNPIKSAAVQSVTNKLSDYIALGKPILNSQLNVEVVEILQKFPHANYDAGIYMSVCDSVKKMIDGQVFLSTYPYNEKFDRAISYSNLKNFMESL
jgi:glycosyltransferase involved in cell wall biosynthesis